MIKNTIWDLDVVESRMLVPLQYYQYQQYAPIQKKAVNLCSQHVLKVLSNVI